MFNLTTNETANVPPKNEKLEIEPGTGQDWEVLARKAIKLRAEGNSWAATAAIMNNLGYRTITGLKMQAATLQSQTNRIARANGLPLARVRVNGNGTVSPVNRPGHRRTHSAYVNTYSRGAETTQSSVPMIFIKTVLNDETLEDSTKVQFLRKLIA